MAAKFDKIIWRVRKHDEGRDYSWFVLGCEGRKPVRMLASGITYSRMTASRLAKQSCILHRQNNAK